MNFKENKWTNDDIITLIELYQNKSPRDIAKIMNRSEGSILIINIKSNLKDVDIGQMKMRIN